MLCDICGREGARTRRVTETYGKGENLIVIGKYPYDELPSLWRELLYSRYSP